MDLLRELRIDPRYVATRQVFQRARGRAAVEDAKRYGPNDPGLPEYVTAFADILERGEEALNLRFASTVAFDVSLWQDARATRDEARFRWLRILSSSGELLIAQEPSLHQPLAALLVDAFALAETGDSDSPIRLLSDLCRETAEVRDGVAEATFCRLAELPLSAHERLDDVAIRTLCEALEAQDRRYRDGWPAPGTEFIWGLTFFDQFHPVWLELVRRHFPESPEAAASVKDRLLRDGAGWAGLPRMLS